MSSDRVIQDSDDSEDDLATSIDPLQSPEKTAHQLPHETEPVPSNPEGSTNLDLNLTVNFDEFLASPEATGHLSYSQQQRENAWLGERDEGQTAAYVPTEDDAYPTPSVSAIPDHPPRKSSLKRGRTIDVSAGRGVANNLNKKGRKRRKTVNDSSTVDGEHDDFTGPANKNVVFDFDPADRDDDTFDELARNEIAPGHHPELVLAAPSVCEAEDEVGSKHLDHDELSSLSSSPRKRSTARSKSMQTTSHSSPHDTEPFSSVRPRARRSMTSSADVPSLSSPDASHDELAFPAPVHVTMNITRRDLPGENTHIDTTQESDRDELSSEAYIGLPKECYKPRPSRSRSIRLEDTRATVPEEKTTNHVAIVVPPVQRPDTEAKVENEALPENINNHDDKMDALDNHGLPAVVPPVSEQDDDAPMRPPPRKLEIEENYEAPKPAKRGPKKKLKRGKTTSVMIKKVVDSDVEDDVIWVDEKPSKVKMAKLPEGPKGTKAEPDDAPEKVEDDRDKINSGTFKEDIKVEPTGIEANAPVDPPAPAPKKRGRKRKKTTDMPPPEAEAPALPDDAETQTHETQPEPLAERDPNTTSLPSAEHKIEQPTPLHENQQPPGEESTAEQLIPLDNAPASPTKTTPPPPVENLETPKKPDKHSPLSTKNKVPYRVGLSRTARIAPLLKVIRK